MSKRVSIGTWAYTIGPYSANPVPFDTVCTKLKELGFDGVELGAFPPHPNPGNPNGPDADWPGALPEKSQRTELRARMEERGLGFSGIAANLWGEKLITDDPQVHPGVSAHCEFAVDLGIGGVRVDTVQPHHSSRDRYSHRVQARWLNIAPARISPPITD